jgi:branched-chain amino acid transport system permease protein
MAAVERSATAVSARTSVGPRSIGPIPLGSIVRTGIIAGLVAIYAATAGLFERFQALNLVGEQITFSRVVLLCPPLLAGYVVARSRIVAGERRSASPPSAALAGALVGVVTMAVLSIAVWWIDRFDVERIRPVFITVTTGLVDFLTFNGSVGGGIVLLLLIGLVAGAVGGLSRVAPASVRRPIALGVAVVILLGLVQRVATAALEQLDVERDWLYSKITFSLTPFGAALAFVVTALVAVAWERRGRAARDRLRQTAAEQPSVRVASILVILALLALLPPLVGADISLVLGTVMVFLLLGVGLNIVVGYAGLLDLGYVAFFAFGAYTTGLLTGASLNTTTGTAAPALSLHLNFYVAVFIVAALAAGLGVLIGAPVLRLRGDYLAIVTLGLGEIVTTITRSTWAQPLVGGPQGMTNITDAGFASFHFRDTQTFYYLALAFVVLAMFVSWRLSMSRIGRAWNAMREDEQVADAIGISTTKFKLLAFAIGGAIGSLGGALFAVKLGSLTPVSFEIIISITALAVVILGGIGSLPGVAVGALVLMGLPGLLREFEEYRLLIYGGVLVAIMIMRPQGLVPNVRRSRELQEEERSQDEWVREAAPSDDAYATVIAGGNLGAETDEDLE